MCRRFARRSRSSSAIFPNWTDCSCLCSTRANVAANDVCSQAPVPVGRALPAIAHPRNAETCDDGSYALRSMRRGLDLVHLESRRAKPALREIELAVRAGHGWLPIRMKTAAPVPVGRALPAIACERSRIFARLSRAGDNVISRFSVESEGDA